jgi:hypothetical protein
MNYSKTTRVVGFPHDLRKRMIYMSLKIKLRLAHGLRVIFTLTPHRLLASNLDLPLARRWKEE